MMNPETGQSRVRGLLATMGWDEGANQNKDSETALGSNKPVLSKNIMNVIKERIYEKRVLAPLVINSDLTVHWEHIMKQS